MPTDNKKRSSVAVLCCLAISLLLAAIPSFAASPDVVISQVYGGGGNSGATLKNDFVELFNRGTSPVNITGWSLQYAAKGSTGAVTNGAGTLHVLSGTIQPGQYFLVKEAAGTGGTLDLPVADTSGGITLAGSDGKIFLVNNSTPLASTACPITNAAVVDFVGYGASNCAEGGAPTGALSSTNAAIRKSACADTDNNAADFKVAVAAPRNSASPITDCAMPSGTGSAIPSTVDAGNSTLLTVSVTPAYSPVSTGIAVVADLSAIGGLTTQPFFDDGTHGDVVAGDSTYSFSSAIPGGTTPNTYSLLATIADEQARSASTDIALTVTAPPVPVPIHDIQGNGASSPYVGQKVIATGVVTSKTSNGFYLELPDSDQDSDPATSEGVYVYTSSAPTVNVGDVAQVTATVSEYYATTELNSPSIAVLSTGNALPSAIELTPDAQGAFDQLERFEGMLVKVSSPKVIAPTDGSNGASNGVFYVTNGSVPRPFREAGLQPGIGLPAGMPANVPQFDGNPERIRVDTAACTPSFVVSTGDTIPEMTGPLGYYSGDYTVYPCPYSATSTSAHAVALPDRNTDEFTVASFNMLNFTNDAGRIAKASKAIRDVMRTPDVIGVEEVNTLATLQALAAQIDTDAEAAGQSKPGYTAQLLATTGTQNVGFLYRSDRITDVSVVEIGGDVLMPDGKTKVNDRAPLVMTAKVTPLAGSDPFPVTIIVNHLRSLIDVDALTSSGDYARTKRQLGAEYLANLIAQHQAADENVISVGDYNAYEFNDGYVDVLGTVTGKPATADQVLLASDDLVDPDVVDLAMTLPAEKRYSYVENGNAQTLDHIVVTSSLLARPYHLEIAHNNADFPETFYTDTTRPERVSDHDMPVAYFTLPPVEPKVVLSAATVSFGDATVGIAATPMTVTLKNDGTAPLNISSITVDDTVNFSQSNDCGTSLAKAASCTITLGFTPSATRAFAATVSINDDAPGAPHTIALAGTGVQTTVAVSVTQISFGYQPVGTTSAPTTFTLTNTGNQQLIVSDVMTSDNSGQENAGIFAQQNTCSAAIAPGAECTISVTFSPKKTGEVMGRVTIFDNASGAPHTVDLIGAGSAPNVALSKTAIDFGDVNIGSEQVVTATLTNSGTATLHISSITVSGSDFSLPTRVPSGTLCTDVVEAGSYCTIDVAFSPKTVGQKAGAVTITDDAAGSPRTISLSGNGTAAELTVTATALDFGGQIINTVSNSKTITLSNNGTAALSISKIEISGDFSQTNNCPASLAAGANCTVSVNFAPKSAGAKSGALTITHAAAGSPTGVTLTGVGTDFAVATTASGTTSATVNPGQTAAYNLQISGTEGFSGAVALSCSGNPAKTTCTVNPTTVNVTGTTAAAFTVSIATTAPTTQTAGGFQSLPGSGSGWPMLLAVAFVGAACLVVMTRTGKRQMRLAGAFGALLMVAALSSCGGGSTPKPSPITVPGTASGTYTVTVTATSGATTHDIKLTLKVN